MFIYCCITTYNILIVVDEAVNIAHDAIFSNMGQNCCAGSRTFVQEGIYDEFVEKAAKLASQKKVGNPFDTTTQIGPLVKFKMITSIHSLLHKKHFYFINVIVVTIHRVHFFVVEIQCVNLSQ